MDPGSYCREVEVYLGRKNDGHLIRIVGPAFELVSDWANQDIPLRIVCRAIDRTFDRYYAVGRKRRPVRIEYCEANVLDLYDDWRRAVGVASSVSSGSSGRGPSLAKHLEQVITRLKAWRDSSDRPSGVESLIDGLVRELDAARDSAKTARGSTRQRLLTLLADVDGQLVATLRQTAEMSLRVRLREETERDLEPFRERMPSVAFKQAVEAGADRLLRDYFKLPRVSFD